MPRVVKGCVEQLPSGSWRARVYAGIDPVTKREIRLKATIDPRDSRPAWQQVAETLTEAIRSGILVRGDEMPSITELSALQGIGTGVIRHALETLTADCLIIARHGRHGRRRRAQR